VASPSTYTSVLERKESVTICPFNQDLVLQVFPEMISYVLPRPLRLPQPQEKNFDLPFVQTGDEIPEWTFRSKACNSEKARLLIIARTRARCNRVSQDLFAGTSRL
jgi:hypothetical protein